LVARETDIEAIVQDGKFGLVFPSQVLLSKTYGRSHAKIKTCSENFEGHQVQKVSLEEIGIVCFTG
jgi:hypothetical protein